MQIIKAFLPSMKGVFVNTDKMSGETDKEYKARMHKEIDDYMKEMAELSEETEKKKQELMKKMAIKSGKTDKEVMKEMVEICPELGMSREEQSAHFDQLRKEAHEENQKEMRRHEATKSFFQGLKSMVQNILLASQPSHISRVNCNFSLISPFSHHFTGTPVQTYSHSDRLLSHNLLPDARYIKLFRLGQHAYWAICCPIAFIQNGE